MRSPDSFPASDYLAGSSTLGLAAVGHLDVCGYRLPRSLLCKACAYLLAHWEPLVAHQQHSQTRLDINLVENAIRLLSIGKKNWLFIEYPGVGQRSAIIYSLVVSCQHHGKTPLAYLRDVLTRLPAMANRDGPRPIDTGSLAAQIVESQTGIVGHVVIGTITT